MKIKLLALMVSCLVLCGVSALAEEGTTENLKPALQIVNQTSLKVLVQVNSGDTAQNGLSSQVMAVRNLLAQYSSLGMKPGRDFDIAMVFRSDGAQFLLSDEAYDLKAKKPHDQGNPSRVVLESLSKAGVNMYECQVSMKGKGYEPADLLPFSRVVISGIGTIIDFEKSGYQQITP
jgi:intracellular sulfur oxidation DsrE/DsrF family protein